MSAYPKVAIIGRPNVGKSTLFNRLIGMRHSIIDKAKGVTRDRLYYDMDWSGNHITLIDTGGIVTANDQEELLKNVRKQSLRAINESDLIVFLVDAKEGIHPLDQEIAEILRRGSKRTILAVNKVDNEKTEPEIHEFSSLGFGYIAAVSALHGRGIGNLLDTIINNTAKVSAIKSDSGIIKIAIIGRPNAGKSSFLNRLIKDDRVLVDSVPGTTRDSVDTYFRFGDTNFMLIDTAGIRHRGKVKAGVDYFSSIRTEQSITEPTSYYLWSMATKGCGATICILYIKSGKQRRLWSLR
ncbi:MAG: ribosome biogenesis GTPase Der [Candidatus Omnitrophica bacterium]|nr:ribosome biogenesis GTPase Der [Candidatus Omnitrophota bacterium]